MSINGIKGNIGGIDKADLLKQQELTDPSKRTGNFGGLTVKQVPPPNESPLNALQAQSPTNASTYTKPITNIDSLDTRKDFASQLQSDANRLVNQIQQLQATTKGAENPNAVAGVASTEATKKGFGVNSTGLGEGVAGARRLEATNDPVNFKDSGETGAARKASSPTDQIAQIMAKVVELQKQLVSDLSERPQIIKISDNK